MSAKLIVLMVVVFAVTVMGGYMVGSRMNPETVDVDEDSQSQEQVVAPKSSIEVEVLESSELVGVGNIQRIEFGPLLYQGMSNSGTETVMRFSSNEGNDYIFADPVAIGIRPKLGDSKGTFVTGEMEMYLSVGDEVKIVIAYVESVEDFDYDGFENFVRSSTGDEELKALRIESMRGFGETAISSSDLSRKIISSDGDFLDNSVKVIEILLLDEAE